LEEFQKYNKEGNRERKVRKVVAHGLLKNEGVDLEAHKASGVSYDPENIRLNTTFFPPCGRN